MMDHVQRLLVSSLVGAVSFALVACGGGGTDTQPEPMPEPQETGEVKVTVNLEGKAPNLEPIEVANFPECGKEEIPDETVVQNDNGTLKNVVVAVKEGPDNLPEASPEVPTIDQENCMYTPRVVTARVGQTLEITDSDQSMHNVRGTKGEGSQVFNFSTFKGDSVEHSFDQAGIFSLVCDVHPWMQGYVYVTSHGHAGVTGESGTVTLSELPAGDYVLEVWHEKYGSTTLDVTVEADQTIEESVSYSG